MSESLGDQLASICPEPIISVNREGIITLFNPAAEKLLGYVAEDVINTMNISEIYHPQAAGRQVKRLMYDDDMGGFGQVQGHESAMLTKDCAIVPIQISATLLMEADTEVGSIGFFHDLTSRKKLEQTLKQQSITDSLSGLYNQRHFQSTLIKEIARSNRYKHPLTLVCLDMDNFKSVNDQLGHIIGDSVISFMGQIIRDELRECDFGFRYGGDEFMLILPEAEQDQALVVTGRLLQAFTERPPLAHITNPPKVSISIGVAEFSQGEGPEDLFKRADFAMYQAKNQGGSQVITASESGSKNKN